MSSLVKDVIVDAGGKQDTAASPPRLFFLSDCPRNSSVRRRLSDTDLEEKAHRCHIALFRVTHEFQLLVIILRVCGISTVFPWRIRPWRGSAQREGRMGETWGCSPSGLQTLVPGCQAEWRLVLSAVVYSLIQPSKRTPFRGGLVDGRRRSAVSGRGGQIVDYSDTYRDGGLRGLNGEKIMPLITANFSFTHLHLNGICCVLCC